MRNQRAIYNHDTDTSLIRNLIQQSIGVIVFIDPRVHYHKPVVVCRSFGDQNRIERLTVKSCKLLESILLSIIILTKTLVDRYPPIHFEQWINS